MVDIRQRARDKNPETVTPEADDVASALTTIPRDLLEHLLEKYGTTPSPEHTGGMDGMVNTAIAVAEQRGQERVLAFLTAHFNGEL